ncbi:putative transposase [Arthrobacter sp. A2-55]|uniref:putative transposase n=1 Tax=Arthrobacter sp. A2-55 TaxID=2897337 RepID=UPI0021CD79EC|nr:hypothetical protein [Arthrobacter sp. A2-55]MCU6480085.1 hypothetical protein [Arthrobacter sp. A2-55]
MLTWRKGASKDVAEKLFTEATHTDEHGQERKWSVADTVVELPLAATKTTGEVFNIRQVSRIVAATGGGTRQIHILTTDRAMSAGEAVYRMGAKWRQENQFRQSLLHAGPGSHDSYASRMDDEDRMVKNPAKAKAYQLVVAARARHAEAAAVADANLLALKTPPEGAGEVTVTSTTHNHVMAPVWEAENALIAAEKTHKAIPAKLRLGDPNPGQQVLDTETKLIHHGIRMAAYNTAMSIAREIRTNTGYRRATQEAHALMRQALNQTGDIDTTEPGYLTITLEPLPTPTKTAAIADLCDHVTTTKTHYPGTDLILRYKIKNHA